MAFRLLGVKHYESIQLFLTSDPGVSIFLSLMTVILALALRLVLLRVIKSWNIRSLELKRRWIRQTRFLVSFIIVVGLTLIWAKNLISVALSLAALAVAFVIGTKELLMCVMGSLLKTSTQSFRVGNHIEVDGIEGLVVETTLLTTSIFERSPTPEGRVFTGKLINIPNSLFLSAPVYNRSIGASYTLHKVEIAFEKQEAAELLKRQKVLESIIQEFAGKDSAVVSRLMERYAEIKSIETPDLGQRVTLDLSCEKNDRLIARYPCRIGEEQTSQQMILEKFLSQTERTTSLKSV